jgi:hypothetical protein
MQSRVSRGTTSCSSATRRPRRRASVSGVPGGDDGPPAGRHRCGGRDSDAEPGDAGLATVSLVEFAARHELTGVRLLKIDADGQDLAIIRGGLGWISEQQPVLFFEYFEIGLRAAGDDGLSTLQQLRRIGYDTILCYDNLGRFRCAASLANEGQRQLYGNIAGGRGAFGYYDVCVFHERDADLAEYVIEHEERFPAAHS